jgi:hypothetical protein
LAEIISDSASNGISPQTMSYNTIPNDQTVTGSAKYLFWLIHSGGEYSVVPSKSEYLPYLK